MDVGSAQVAAVAEHRRRRGSGWVAEFFLVAVSCALIALEAVEIEFISHPE